MAALEDQSQLFDAAVASADEAKQRWEECQLRVDQLNAENAALRAALAETQLLLAETNGSYVARIDARVDRCGEEWQGFMRNT